MKPLKPYHLAWLAAHPKRTEEWLRERLADGFQVHHIDQNHKNHEPQNLILIDGQDHLSIFHGMKKVDLFVFRPRADSAHMKRISELGRLAIAKKMARKAKAQHAAKMRWAKRHAGDRIEGQQINQAAGE